MRRFNMMLPHLVVCMAIRFSLTFLVCLAWILATAPRSEAQITLRFAHIADGPDAKGVWTTLFSVVDTSSGPAACTVALFADAGTPLTLASSLGTNSTFFATIPPNGTWEFQTNGAGVSGSLVGGYAILTCDNPVFGADIYTYTTPSGGAVAQVGVLSQFASNRFSSQANAYTGIAIVNLNATATMTATINVYDTSANLVGTKTLTLKPLQHMAFTLSSEVTLPSNFVGSVQISTDLNDMIALAIGFVPNTTTYTSSSIPSIYYTQPAHSYSGTCTVIAGPDVGTSATCAATGISPIAREEFIATSTFTVNGTIHSGQLVLKETLTPAGVHVSIIDINKGNSGGDFFLNTNGTLTGVIEIATKSGAIDILTMTLSPGA
jgi:hypothetical protein